MEYYGSSGYIVLVDTNPFLDPVRSDVVDPSLVTQSRGLEDLGAPTTGEDGQVYLRGQYANSIGAGSRLTTNHQIVRLHAGIMYGYNTVDS